MDREKAKEMLPFIQALADGKTIQHKVGDEWCDLSDPNFVGFDTKLYRVKPKTEAEFMTHKQLAEWCAKGNGQFKFNGDNTCFSSQAYSKSQENSFVIDILIRRWNSDEWIEPTLDVYLEDCRKEY